MHTCRDQHLVLALGNPNNTLNTLMHTLNLKIRSNHVRIRVGQHHNYTYSV